MAARKKNDGSNNAAESARMKRAGNASKSAQGARQAQSSAKKAKGAAWKASGLSYGDFNAVWREAQKWAAGPSTAPRSDTTGTLINSARRTTNDLGAQRAEQRQLVKLRRDFRKGK
jgi:hypothetical protein